MNSKTDESDSMMRNVGHYQSISLSKVIVELDKKSNSDLRGRQRKINTIVDAGLSYSRPRNQRGRL